MGSKSKFQNLTIRGNFMFAAVMMKDDNCKKFLEMVLGISINKIVVNSEKSISHNPDYKGVRLDVYANDGSISIVLSTKGENAECIPENLKNFLSFVKEDNAQNNSETDDEYVRQLQKSIRSVKEDRELESEFMAWDAIRDDIREEGREEGILIGKRMVILNILGKLGVISDSLEKRIQSETGSEKLDAMSMIAANATSFSEFEEQISKL